MATIIDGYSYTYYLIVVTICYWLLLFNIDIIDKEYDIVDIDRKSVVLSFLARASECGNVYTREDWSARNLLRGDSKPYSFGMSASLCGAFCVS